MQNTAITCILQRLGTLVLAIPLPCHKTCRIDSNEGALFGGGGNLKCGQLPHAGPAVTYLVDVQCRGSLFSSAAKCSMGGGYVPSREVVVVHVVLKW